MTEQGKKKNEDKRKQQQNTQGDESDKKGQTLNDDLIPTQTTTPNEKENIQQIASTQKPTPTKEKNEIKPEDDVRKSKQEGKNGDGPEPEQIREQPSSWKDQTSQTKSGRVKGDPLKCQIMDLLMFCCLLTSTTTLWKFPTTVLDLGGFYFIIVYLLMLFIIVFPVLHLEIYVGQYCQAGIYKACRSYGLGYEGFGLAVVFTAAVCGLAGEQQTYTSVKHIINLVTSPESTVSCRYMKISDPFLAYRCTSLFDNKWCLNSGDGFMFYGRRCINDSTIVTSQVRATDRYYVHLTSEPNADFDLYRLLYTFFVYCSLALLGVCGMKVIRLFLAVTYLCFILLLIVSFLQFLDIGKFSNALSVLSRASNPESIFDANTYIIAFHSSIVSCGIGLSGILCASSFRNRNNSSFKLTYGIVLNNAIISIISLFMFLCVMSAMGGKYRVLGEDLFSSGYEFGITTVTEVFMVKEKSVIWIVAYNLSVYIVSVVSFCGPVIIISALVRDTAERHRQLWTAWAVIAFCLTAFLASVPRSITNIGEQWEHVIIAFYECMLFFVLSVMVLAFVHVYGEREYVVDLAQLYPIKDGYRPWTSPAHPVHLRIFEVVTFLFLILMVLSFVYTLGPNRVQKSLLFVISSYGLVLTVLAFILGLLVYNGYGSIRRGEGLSTLFFVTPEHPSYWRITALAGVEEAAFTEEVQ
ncbi:hypothetical protein RB195_008687 [Necator americanus]|uniref:Sodium:neurotransmitter symporter family protein n=1 Tax=Necator americanus TaxID=51031 RepID=A0ABR1CSD4_NECAM